MRQYKYWMGTPSADDEGSSSPFPPIAYQWRSQCNLHPLCCAPKPFLVKFISSSKKHVNIIWTEALKHTHLTKPAAPSRFHKMRQSLCNARKPRSSPSYQTTTANIAAGKRKATNVLLPLSTLSAVRRGGWIIVGIHGGEVRRSPVRSFHTGEQGEHVHSMRGANALKRGFQASRLWSLVSQGVSGHMWVWASRSSVISHSDYLQLLPSSW